MWGVDKFLVDCWTRIIQESGHYVQKYGQTADIKLKEIAYSEIELNVVFTGAAVDGETPLKAQRAHRRVPAKPEAVI